jgi:hypothetical protein
MRAASGATQPLVSAFAKVRIPQSADFDASATVGFGSI